ncbi:MAG: ergothioneine biosynthesis protein EgtB [Pseudomonadota bacterium]
MSSAAHSAPYLVDAAPDERTDLLGAFHTVRGASTALTAHLSLEDMMLQSMEDASPAKWHLGHTSWFFETFILSHYVPSYTPFDPTFKEVFNSYYVSVGARHARHARGLLSRPSAADVLHYRAHIEAAIDASFGALPPAALDLLELGLHHERQHQELLLTDLLHALSFSPLYPAIAQGDVPRAEPVGNDIWHRFDGGLASFGHSGNGFAFDNEGPQHAQHLTPFALAGQLVTNANWRAFMADGGYETPLLWLSDGWTCAQKESWDAPLYWHRGDDDWQRFSAYGLIDIDPNAPVCHISFYEADAFARWAGARLPSEYEMEHAVGDQPIVGRFVEDGALTPLGGHALYGDVWAWTQSSYAPYPRYKAVEGPVGEYNGKFMANQMVLRGGSCFTPRGQIRASYRNFFYPHQRWQMSGLRLAKDI